MRFTPKISVIVPVYNVEPYIHRCVDSILGQTFTDFELILVDDGSPDNCGRICDEYAEKDSRVHVIHQQNGGLSAARNAGIDWSFANSNSKWLTFIDSDDWVHKQYFELLYCFAIENNLKLVSCKYIFAKDFVKDKIIKSAKKIVDLPEQLYLNYTLDIGLSCLSLYDKMLFCSVRFPVGKTFEDMQVITPILYSQKTIGFIDECLYYYYVNPISITNGQKTPKWINDLLSSHILQLIFLQKNCFFLTLNSRYNRLKKIFSELIKQYGEDENYINIFKNNYLQSKKVFKKAKTILFQYNPELKKYGFKKWFTGQADELEQLKCDIQAVSKERGKFFATIWGIKNRISIYRRYYNLPI